MVEIEKKYGFPLFTRQANNIYLGNSKKLIISDIWAFWDYIIKKTNYEKAFMSSLLEQAKNFYMAAENSPLKSKPLLFYYSFLNLAKVMINLEKRYGRVQYKHGISENHHSKFSLSTITLQQVLPTPKKVASELIGVLDNVSIAANTTFNLKEHLIHCVGIHRTYSEIYGIEEVFFRIDEMKIYKDGMKISIKAKVNCKAPHIPSLVARGYNIIEEEGIHFWVEEINSGSYNITRNSYYAISKHLRDRGVWYFIGDDGYTYYISEHEHHRYSPEIIIYNAMFFFGSITRYHPYLFDSLLSDKEQWLMSEFLTTQPKQFIYLATAKVLGMNVLKAYSSF